MNLYVLNGKNKNMLNSYNSSIISSTSFLDYFRNTKQVYKDLRLNLNIKPIQNSIIQQSKLVE